MKGKLKKISDFAREVVRQEAVDRSRDTLFPRDQKVSADDIHRIEDRLEAGFGRERRERTAASEKMIGLQAQANQGISQLLDSNTVTNQKISGINEQLQSQQQSHVALSKDVKKLLQEYGYDSKFLHASVGQQKQFNDLIATHLTEQQKAQAIQDANNRLDQQLTVARTTFSGMQSLGRQIGSSVLTKIGSIGEQGISIASNIAALKGVIPALAAPATGLSMLLPMAGIAIAASSIIFTLTQEEDESHPMQEALIGISQQIATLREELHGRFDHVDKQLVCILEKMDVEFKHLEAVLRSDIADLRIKMTHSFDRVIQHTLNMQRLLVAGVQEARLDKYRKLLFRIKQYYSSGDLGHNNAKENITEKISDLEQLWLIENLCSDTFNSGQHYNTTDPNSYLQVTQLAAISQDESLILGFLAAVAKDKLGLKIKDVNLPNLKLWLPGISTVLNGRQFLKQQYKTELDPKRLKQIREKADATITFVSELTNSEELYLKLISLYFNGVVKLQHEFKKQIEKMVRTLANETCETNTIRLETIHHEEKQQPGFPDLNAGPLLTTLNQSVSKLLIEAQKRKIGEWTGSYLAYYATYAYPKYDITLSFNAGAEAAVLKTHYEAKWPPVHVSSISQIRRLGDPRPPLVQVVSTWGAHPGRTQPLPNTFAITEKEETNKILLPKIVENILQNILGNKPDEIYDKIRDQLKESEFTEILDQLKAVQTLALLYGRIIGFPKEILIVIKEAFVADFNAFVTNPALFMPEKQLGNIFQVIEQWKNSNKLAQENEEKSAAQQQTAVLEPTREMKSYESTVSKDNLQIKGLKYQQILGDGNCFFNAVALYANQDWQVLRNLTATRIEQKPELRRLLPLAPGQTEEQYLKTLREGRGWADHIEINELMGLLDRAIIIIGPNKEIRNKDQYEQYLNRGKPIFVYYNGCDHYDALILEKDYVDKEQEIINKFQIAQQQTNIFISSQARDRSPLIQKMQGVKNLLDLFERQVLIKEFQIAEQHETKQTAKPIITQQTQVAATALARQQLLQLEQARQALKAAEEKTKLAQQAQQAAEEKAQRLRTTMSSLDDYRKAGIAFVKAKFEDKLQDFYQEYLINPLQWDKSLASAFVDGALSALKDRAMTTMVENNSQAKFICEHIESITAQRDSFVRDPRLLMNSSLLLLTSQSSVSHNSSRSAYAAHNNGNNSQGNNRHRLLSSRSASARESKHELRDEERVRQNLPTTARAAIMANR